jgi:hypothetical protein
MVLFSRPDGRLVRELPAYRRMMPYLMRTRNESAVYFRQVLDLGKTLPFLEQWNAAHPQRMTLFHLFLFAAVRTLHERPRLNRFVSGGRIWDRHGIWISFSAKKALHDNAPIVVVKRPFDPGQPMNQMLEGLHADLDRGRSNEKSHVDKELSLLLALPGPLLRLLVGLQRWADGWNLLPGAFLHSDPMYGSMFIANLGSLKIDAAYHHLYEYGNMPIFATLGKVHKEVTVDEEGKPTVSTVCEVKYTFDERIEDGLYCARALDHLRTLVENPEAMLTARLSAANTH